MFRLQPLTRPVDLQTGAVDQHVQRTVGHQGRLDADAYFTDVDTPEAYDDLLVRLMRRSSAPEGRLSLRPVAPTPGSPA